MSGGEALRVTAFDILESGLYVFLQDEQQFDPGESVRFTMAIQGPGTNGEVGMEATVPAARELAAQMLGIDLDEVGSEEASASVAEALNMVAGALMLHTVGTAPELELRPPVAGGEPHGDAVVFRTGAGTLRLWYAA